MRFRRLLMTSSGSIEATDTETKGVFGSSLTSRLRHTGRAVAPCITKALQYINDTASHSDGLFRRPGVLSRVQKLQEIMNSDSGKRLLLLLSRIYIVHLPSPFPFLRGLMSLLYLGARRFVP